MDDDQTQTPTDAPDGVQPSHAVTGVEGPEVLTAPAGGTAVPPAEGAARPRRRVAIGAALVVGMAVGGGGTAAALGRTPSAAAAGSTTEPVTTPVEAPSWPGLSAVPSTPRGSSGESSQEGSADGGTGYGGAPDDSSGELQDGTGASGTTGTTVATGDAAEGVVTVAALVSENGMQGVSAGTGMVLTSDGIVLTNNHVVEGATAVQVTDPTTGTTYDATVVATDARADVAVLQLTDASDLATVTLDDDSGAAVGDDVTSVGNAEGQGTLMAASGAVVALDQTITTQTETVGDLFAFSAGVVEGDSGGPVYDDEGEVVGMTTAVSTNGVQTIAYAIDIQDAMAVAVQLDPALSSSDAV
ncbi:trypsin-like peptidase domain-containing protein [Cellulomonas sp. JH27-2]|uniref:S1C family serine protease n=1 Tax=Cellulomonas sp. JH27-2 TaxID=2774139 RepID=UPI001785FB93|nr:serine protease [Cellulomonas sp. JH27-2]MBD8059966.1 trypsin-like peptidase domain-containing protein [Cellulomonas sp. JH27-2]